MKKIITFSIISFLMLSFYTGRTQTVVFSSGFENWSTATPPLQTDWTGTKTNIAADSVMQYQPSHSGTYAAKLENRLTSSKRLASPNIAITSATTYTFTFWAKGHGSIMSAMYRGGGSGFNAYVDASYVIVDDTTTWIQVVQTISCDTNSATGEFIFYVKSTKPDLGDLQIDDVSITATTTPTVSCYDIQYTTATPAVSPYNGQAVITGGIVSARFNKGFFMQDAYGPWNGVYVYDSAHAAALNLVEGDSITLSGKVTEFYTYTELGNISGITRVSSGNPVHAAYPVTGANSNDESLEGVLVQLTDIPCVKAPNSYGEWVVYDTDSSYIGKLLYAYTPIVRTSYNITGVVYNNGGPNVIEPRDANDISVVTGINELNKTSINIYPNPVSNYITINNMSGVNTIKISNVLGETIANINVSGSTARINVSNLSNGIYVISLMNEKNIIETRKFVKN